MSIAVWMLELNFWLTKTNILEGRDKSHYFSSLDDRCLNRYNNKSFFLFLLCSHSVLSFPFLLFRWFRIHDDNRRRFTRSTNKSNGRNVESIRISICWKAYIEKETTSQNSKYVLILRLFFSLEKVFWWNSWCIWMNVTRERERKRERE